MNPSKILKITLTASMVTAMTANAGQVPVVRPANLGISSPTLPTGTISTPTVATTAPVASAPQVSVPSTSSIIGDTQAVEPGEAGNSGETTAGTAMQAISSTIDILADLTSTPELELTISQQAGLTRTIEAVLVNVEMSPLQRARLISIRESLENGSQSQ